MHDQTLGAQARGRRALCPAMCRVRPCHPLPNQGPHRVWALPHPPKHPWSRPAMPFPCPFPFPFRLDRHARLALPRATVFDLLAIFAIIVNIATIEALSKGPFTKTLPLLKQRIGSVISVQK